MRRTIELHNCYVNNRFHETYNLCRLSLDKAEEVTVSLGDGSYMYEIAVHLPLVFINGAIADEDEGYSLYSMYNNDSVELYDASHFIPDDEYDDEYDYEDDADLQPDDVLALDAAVPRSS